MATRASEAGIRKLYHYQDFDKPEHLTAVLKGKVFYSNPEHFNDPWDCKPWFTQVLSEPLHRTKCINFFDTFYDENGKSLDYAAYKLRLRTDQDFLRQMVAKFTEVTRINIKDRWRMYCLTPYPDNALMWAHYAKKHQGICLEFDTRFNEVGGAWPVNYNSKLPVLHVYSVADQNIMQILLNKSSVWAYENEYRAIAHEGPVDRDTNPQFLPLTDKNYLSMPEGALTAVIAGSAASFDAIKALVDQHAPGLAVKRAVCAEETYKIDIKG